LNWDREGPSRELIAEARSLGFQPVSGQEMLLTHLADIPVCGDLVVRPLDPSTEWPAMVALNRACDPGETGEPTSDYARFKSGLRTEWRSWVDSGHAQWWGAFDGSELLAQCGLVDCPPMGRFQSVETRPDLRRQGICSTLIAAVCRDTLDRGLKTVVLEAEIDGPALGLYRKLGFLEGGRIYGLIQSDEPRKVREEVQADHAGVATLVTAAFKGPAESELIARLRDQDGVWSLVIVRAGDVHGHILFSPVRVVPSEGPAWAAMALGPVAITPRQQGYGVGSELIRQGLARLKQAGHRVVFLLGHPDYYSRFGF
jgi:putative acetyltransferase